MIVVSNTSPIINLAAIGKLDLLKKCFDKVYIPPAVYNEITVKGNGEPGDIEVRTVDWIEVVELKYTPLLLLLEKDLDLENIEIEDTKYVSNLFKKGFSDIVLKTTLKTKKGKKQPVYIYFILEHKTEGRAEIFIQVLKYMVFEWEKDYNNNEPPRLIIPVVFYHGADEWKIPRSFAEQFDVDDDVKRFLLDYRYILFDTNPWDFRDESNKDLKKNVFLFTSMVFMKAAYKHDTEAILEIFKFWYDRGFIENIDVVVYFLEYVSKTQEINRDQLKKMLDESKIDGGEIMPTLAQQMKEEFREEFLDTMGPQLKDEGKKEIAKQMLKKGFDLDTIIDITGLEKTVIEKLSSKL